MNAANGHVEYTRRVTSLDGLDILKPLPGLRDNVQELLEFAHELRASGLDLGPRIDKIEQLWTKAQDVLSFDLTQAVNAIDIDTVDPADIEDIIAKAAMAHTARLRTSFVDAHQDSGVTSVLKEFNLALTKQAGLLLRENADQLVTGMRKDFDKAAKIIGTAKRLGISKSTQRDELLLLGSPEQIAAYRAVPEAVATLDRIADLRLNLTRRVAYEIQMANPPHDVTSFVTNVTDELHLAGAELAWEGDTEHIQYDGIMNGSSIVKARSPRLGGAWLQLVHAGHTLHLNTAAEAAQVALADKIKVG